MSLQWQTPRTFQVNEVEVASYLNAIRDALTFLGNPPVCNAVQGTSQTIVTGTGSNWQALSQDTTPFDSYGMHSNTTNNSRAVSQAAGYYAVSGAACFLSNSTGWRGARIAKNGGAVAGGATELGTNAAGVWAAGTPSVVVYLNVGDYVETDGYQTSGANLSTATNADADSALTATWVHA